MLKQNKIQKLMNVMKHTIALHQDLYENFYTSSGRMKEEVGEKE
jgi:hypothetical protein